MPTKYEGEIEVDMSKFITKPIADIRYVNQSGDVMSGDLHMNGHRLINVADPIDNNDAANKSFVLNTIGNVNNKLHTIQNTLDNDVVNKTYCDSNKSKIEIFGIYGQLPDRGREFGLTSLNHLKVIFGICMKLEDSSKLYRSLEDTEVKSILGNPYVYSRLVPVGGGDYANELVFRSTKDFSNLAVKNYTGKFALSFCFYIMPDSCFN